MNRLPNQLSTGFIKQIILLASILILSGVILYHLSNFIPGFLGALCLFVLLYHPINWVEHQLKINTSVATLIVLTLTTSTILLMVSVALHFIIKHVMHDFEFYQTFIQKALETISNGIKNQTGMNLLKEDNFGLWTQKIMTYLQDLINLTLDGFIQLAVAVFLAFFMLINHRDINRWMFRNIPLKPRTLVNINQDMRNLVFSNTIGVPLVAFLQALVAGLGYMIFDVPNPFVFFILTIIAGMIPVVGSALVYIPAFLVLLSHGHSFNAYIFLGYCILIVGSSDNLFRFLIQKKIANIHPLVTIFGVILGIKLFGFVGIIFGPILFSCLIWLFKVYREEFILKNH